MCDLFIYGIYASHSRITARSTISLYGWLRKDSSRPPSTPPLPPPPSTSSSSTSTDLHDLVDEGPALKRTRPNNSDVGTDPVSKPSKHRRSGFDEEWLFNLINIILIKKRL